MSLVLTAEQLDHPLGTFRLVASPRGLCYLALPGESPQAQQAHLARHFPGAVWGNDPSCLPQARSQLLAYLDGERTAFQIPLDLRGTSFQLAVWQALLAIPYGQTVSYGELARRLGRPGAARAVGRALGANPVPVVVPCHRVVGVGGHLVGYGGGLALKARLLEHEASHVPWPAKAGGAGRGLRAESFGSPAP
jgi:methylated-DNA-[protein]-cysteine S-methyltransferase